MDSPEGETPLGNKKLLKTIEAVNMFKKELKKLKQSNMRNTQMEDLNYKEDKRYREYS